MTFQTVTFQFTDRETGAPVKRFTRRGLNVAQAKSYAARIAGSQWNWLILTHVTVQH